MNFIRFVKSCSLLEISLVSSGTSKPHVYMQASYGEAYSPLVRLFHSKLDVKDSDALVTMTSDNCIKFPSVSLPLPQYTR